jgi:hypothetical protein
MKLDASVRPYVRSFYNTLCPKSDVSTRSSAMKLGDSLMLRVMNFDISERPCVMKLVISGRPCV